MKIIRKENQNTSNWSGGTTTELYIYPEGTIYTERNFEYRISSAIVAVDKSKFTNLEAYSRKIMTLEGCMNLHHENHYDIELNKFDTDSFHGSWNTESEGKVIDFNLMTSKNYDGNIKAIQLSKNKSFNINDLIYNNKIENLSLYIYKGKCTLEGKNINTKDFLLFSIEDFNDNKIFTCIEDSEIVITNIWKS